MNQAILNGIDEASKVIGKTWPLYTFVTSNPLSGLENKSFQEAVSLAKRYFNSNAFPAADLFRQALEKGDIDRSILETNLTKNEFFESPEFYLNVMVSQNQQECLNETRELDRIMAKWLASFMDEGLAEWEMPYKSEGFYSAWRLLAVYDSELGTTVTLKDIPKSSEEALRNLLTGYSETDFSEIFSYHLAALPGWTGYINYRTETNTEWQKEYPISLMDYLAVRLWTAEKLNISFLPENDADDSNLEETALQYVWLKSWEQTWQEQLVNTLEKENRRAKTKNTLPDAQLVFCIDTRSELIRRHVESKGNYETFGYAGFFGIAMDYERLDNGIVHKACPPIVPSAYRVSEIPQTRKEEDLEVFKEKTNVTGFVNYFLKRMKNMLPSAFGFVEGSGLFYGFSLLGRTLLPGRLYRAGNLKASGMESICQPQINKAGNEDSLSRGISLEEKVNIVKSAFQLTGWKQFAPLVIFAGHGSHSANNPFGSSLDCGACAASPGRQNARMLAKLANLPEVRKVLRESHNILIPENTIFIGAEHNTTTDEIVLFDSEVPEPKKSRLEVLKADLLEAQKSATRERLGVKRNSIASAHRKASDWGETRPEWGLAKNAGFIVGPRNLTKNTNLDSRCFLHSYEWEMDQEGSALEAIMQGPMVVTQWINNHYYFSTIDNKKFGGGSKITQNITGKFGVVQGNGGDLKMGLPLQSLFSSDDTMYHQPLRLSVVIHAPLDRVTDILRRNTKLKALLDNEWIYLMVMNPDEHDIFKYKKSLQWDSVSSSLTRVEPDYSDELATSVV